MRLKKKNRRKKIVGPGTAEIKKIKEEIKNHPALLSKQIRR